MWVSILSCQPPVICTRYQKRKLANLGYLTLFTIVTQCDRANLCYSLAKSYIFHVKIAAFFFVMKSIYYVFSLSFLKNFKAHCLPVLTVAIVY